MGSWGHPWSCPLFCTAQVPALALEEKNTLSRGKARKDGEVGGQEKRPRRSLQTFGGLVELDSTGAAPGPVGRRGPQYSSPNTRGAFSTWLGLAIHRAGPTIFQRNKKNYF